MLNEPRTHRLPWIIGLVLLLGSALGAGWFLNHTPAGGETTLSPGEKSALTPPVTVCFGLVDVSPGVTKLYPVVPGRVLEVATEGTEVNKGDVLIKLDSRMAELRLAEAKADLASALKLLAQAKTLPAQHNLKKKQQESAIQAFKHDRESINQELKVKTEGIGLQIRLAYEEKAKKLDSLVEMEEAKLDELKLFDSRAQSEIDRAEADVSAKEARVDMAKFGLKECIVRAPSDGIILRVLTHVGEVLGGNPAAPAIQFCPKGPKIIRAEVLQEWAYRVAVGQDVTIEDDTFAGATWQGRVQRVSNWFAEKRNKIFEPFMVNDVRTLECLIEVTSEGQPLRIGQRVRVKIKQAAS